MNHYYGVIINVHFYLQFCYEVDIIKDRFVSMRIVIDLFIWFFLLWLVDAGYSAERYVDQVDCL